MSPKVQVLLLIVGLITFLAVHAEEELNEIEESERSCAEAVQILSTLYHVAMISLGICNAMRTNCKCKKGVFRIIRDWIGK
uniref:U5-Lycotoxin-Lsp1q_1 n=1 Tax=Lycosa sp. SGP-2016 TaxID=1905177 RepID=A0A482ZEX3_9ARAC